MKPLRASTRYQYITGDSRGGSQQLNGHKQEITSSREQRCPMAIPSFLRGKAPNCVCKFGKQEHPYFKSFFLQGENTPVQEDFRTSFESICLRP